MALIKFACAHICLRWHFTDRLLDVSGVNSVILSGSTREMTIESQGICDIDLSNLSVENLKVNADDLCQVTHPTND
jgi:hypothetical protein